MFDIINIVFLYLYLSMNRSYVRKEKKKLSAFFPEIIPQKILLDKVRNVIEGGFNVQKVGSELPDKL